MITVKNKVFRLDTPNTTYMFRVTDDLRAQQLFYGDRIGEVDDVTVLADKQGSGQGTAISIGKGENRYFPDNTRFECSDSGRGDYRESIVTVSDLEGSTAYDLLYDGYAFVDFSLPDMPFCKNREQTLAVYFKDDAKKIKLTLFYSTFADCDVIAKSVAVENYGNADLKLLRVMSNQLDLDGEDYVLDSLEGSWGRERQIESCKLHSGVTRIDSNRGVSSNHRNPFFVLKKGDCALRHGEAYGFNLVYSGNHAAVIDKTPLGKVRVLNGINDRDFCWTLKPQTTFYSPEATLCYSSQGTGVLSQRYHKFVNEHVIPEKWQYKERPILVNNWEATYFKFTEKKLLEIAQKAKNLGIELFVLDDGWFGNRTNDTKGLGDWTVNTKRLPKGLSGLAKKITSMGLKFGVWVEPEMVNPDSDLYRKHPDWAVKHPGYKPLECRNQLLLDLTNREVCDYVIEAMTKVFSSADISYVKWDFNRPLTDHYSPTLKNRQGEFFHRFTLGYYYIVKTLTEKFPDILFEGCASGGNRFDLGVLSYMPQIWCSDNTDSFDRVKIHEGTLYGYPPSCIGSHVSASPNHQTLRESSVDCRFNTACIGAFGYELDLSALNKNDEKSIKKQIAWYKKYRKTLQFGNYFQIKSVFCDDKACWAMVSDDKSQAVVNLTNKVQQTIPSQTTLKVYGLDGKTKYRFETRRQTFGLKMFGGLINQVSPVHLNDESKLVEMISDNFPIKSEKESYVVTGELLSKCGIKLNQEWASTGFDGNTRIMRDFGSRLYSIDKIDG